MKLKISSIIVILAASQFAIAAGNGIDDQVISLVAQHGNGAPNASQELELVAGLEKIAADHADAWLPQFWASYFLTQIVMSHSNDKNIRLNRAQGNLDDATSRAKTADEYDAASFLSLQSLIYRFRITDQDDQATLDALRTQILTTEQQAFSANPNSPVAMVMAATNIINAGQKERHWEQIMGGYSLLTTARDEFMNDERPKGLTTHFNSEWVRPWINWVERMYKDGIEAE